MYCHKLIKCFCLFLQFNMAKIISHCRFSRRALFCLALSCLLAFSLTTMDPSVNSTPSLPACSESKRGTNSFIPPKLRPIKSGVDERLDPIPMSTPTDWGMFSLNLLRLSHSQIGKWMRAPFSLVRIFADQAPTPRPSAWGKGPRPQPLAPRLEATAPVDVGGIAFPIR